MRLVSASIALLSSIAFSLPSLAATVESIQGNVLINRGEGYQPATAQAQISAGDLIMASPGGSADVVYYDGCRVTVQPGAVVAIARKPPCGAGSMMHLGAGSYKDSPMVFEDSIAPPIGGSLVGALALGGIAAIVLLQDDGNERRRIVSVSD